MLLNQHSMLFGDEDGDGSSSAEERRAARIVGMVDTRCRVRDLVVGAHDAAGIICEQFYHVFPELSITEVSLDSC